MKAARGEVVADNAAFIEDALAEARPGDVLFKNGGGLWGRLAARFSENDDGYGHVGMVDTGPDGALVVIHAGGDPATGNGRVQATGLAQFLRAAKGAALYRPKLDAPHAAIALSYVEAAAGRNAPFDSAFSLDTEDELYCTELVWRALSRAVGEDVVPEKSERSGKVYVAIDDLQESPWLAPLWRYQQATEGAPKEIVSARSPS